MGRFSHLAHHQCGMVRPQDRGGGCGASYSDSKTHIVGAGGCTGQHSPSSVHSHPMHQLAGSGNLQKQRGHHASATRTGEEHGWHQATGGCGENEPVRWAPLPPRQGPPPPPLPKPHQARVGPPLPSPAAASRGTGSTVVASGPFRSPSPGAARGNTAIPHASPRGPHDADEDCKNIFVHKHFLSTASKRILTCSDFMFRLHVESVLCVQLPWCSFNPVSFSF